MRPPSLNPFCIISLQKHRGRALLALQTFNLELSTFDLLHPLYFHYVTLSFPQRAFLNPLFINHFRTLVIATGGVHPLLSSASGSSGPVGRYNLLPSYPLSFHTLAHSFAISCIFLHLRNQQLFSFHGITHSSTKKNRGWGPAAWSPKNKMIYLPNPLSSLTAVNCPLLTTRQKAEPSRLAVLVPVTGLPRPCRGHKSPVTVRRPRNTDSLFQFMDSRGTI